MTRIDAPLIDGFLALAGFFRANKIRYCLIGGIAAGFWGEPRYTRDIDFTVAGRPMKLDVLAKKMRKAGYKTRPVSSSQLQVLGKGDTVFQADIIPAETEYQDWVVQRALPVTIFGMSVAICTAEDLIILKMIAGRRQDDLDVENVLKKSGGQLDKAYLKEWLDFLDVTKRFRAEFGDKFYLPD